MVVAEIKDALKEANYNDPDGDGKDTSVVDNLDEIIARFGDDPSCSFFQDQVQAEDSVIRSFAPTGLEEPFKQLYSILFPCLCSKNDSSMTASAILMGPRGSGKSLVLERCLAACQHQQQQSKTNFRKVMINGIVCRGEDVPSVVYEMIRQLSDMAFQETSATNDSEGEEEKEVENFPRKRRKQRDKYLLRLRKSTFTSNLALLESTLKIAEVDKIPILIVLDELDSFTDEGERQLLLYHLLDRVSFGVSLMFAS